MKKDNFEEIVNKYLVLGNHEHRYTSFDYCYNYFKVENDLTKDMEKSCFELAFYLASWGMFRGSSFLLQKSAKYFVKTIEYINSLEKHYWNIDVDSYNNETYEKIFEIYQNLYMRVMNFTSADVTLITKMILGIFGAVPAYDDFFRKSFKTISNSRCGFTKFNKKSLSIIKEFYDFNKTIIDKMSNETFTYDFISGEKTNINYPKVKIIDMYGFTLSMKE